MKRPVWPLATAFLALVVSWAFSTNSAKALGPNDIWILVNKNSADSRTVADYYCLKRGVPADHVLTFDLPITEDVARTAYEQRLLLPLRDLLKDKKTLVKVILTTYGIPLRVGPDSPTAAEQTQLTALLKQMADLTAQRNDLDAKIATLTPMAATDPTAAQQLAQAKAQRTTIQNQLLTLDSQRVYLSHAQAVCALDSELALMWQPTYDLRLYVNNPLYFRISPASRALVPPVVMTSRLDGPSVDIVKGLVDKAIAAETAGLTGKVYVDAQGRKYNSAVDPVGLGYDAYDESLREYGRLYTKGGMTVVVDDKVTVFPVGACPDCALYCGWYSHALYVDSFTFNPGAVGYHMASSEAVTLRYPGVKYWCKRMLDNGITATLGPVSEPFTQGFPKPAEFFGFLGTGATLVESYWQSQRYASWMIVLVGDPLYKPFAKAPKVKLTDVVISPVGSH